MIVLKMMMMVMINNNDDEIVGENYRDVINEDQ